MAAAFYEYFGRFFENWFLYMTAGPFVTDEILLRLCPNIRGRIGQWVSNKARRRIEVTLLLIGVFYAGFAPFKEERDALEAQLNKPVQPIPIELNEHNIDTEGREDLKNTKAELADTKQKLASANAELRQLKQKAEDRMISAEDRQKVVAALNGAPKGKFITQSDWMDGEAIQFAQQITNILKEAGYEQLDVRTQVLSLNGKGAYMFVKDLKNPPAHAVAIQKAFTEIGISMPGDTADKDMSRFNGSQASNLENDVVIIWVSRK